MFDGDGLKRVPTTTIRLILIVVKTHLQEFRGFNSIFVIAFYITTHPFVILITITFSFDTNYSDLWDTIMLYKNLYYIYFEFFEVFQFCKVISIFIYLLILYYMFSIWQVKENESRFITHPWMLGYFLQTT